jgi:hypothetical protein
MPHLQRSFSTQLPFSETAIDLAAVVQDLEMDVSMYDAGRAHAVTRNIAVQTMKARCLVPSTGPSFQTRCPPVRI